MVRPNAVRNKQHSSLPPHPMLEGNAVVGNCVCCCGRCQAPQLVATPACWAAAPATLALDRRYTALAPAATVAAAAVAWVVLAVAQQPVWPVPVQHTAAAVQPAAPPSPPLLLPAVLTPPHAAAGAAVCRP